MNSISPAINVVSRKSRLAFTRLGCKLFTEFPTYINLKDLICLPINLSQLLVAMPASRTFIFKFRNAKSAPLFGGIQTLNRLLLPKSPVPLDA